MKYQSLEEELVNLILSGEETYLNGRFMSERDISERFNVSRTTVRKAISELCKQGYLLQIHGKGTFIKQSNQYQELDSITRCTQNYSNMGLNPTITVLCQEVTHATSSIAAYLKININEPVLKLKKLYEANKIIFNETLTYLPMARFSGIESADFSVCPIMKILRLKYGMTPKRTDHTIEAVLPPVDTARNLKINTKTPVILFESVTSGISNGRLVPLEYFKCYYKTDRFRFNFIQEYDNFLEYS